MSDIVLVAGGTGGVGVQTIKHLLAQGFKVRALVRDQAKAEKTFSAIPGLDKERLSSIEYVQGSVTDPASLATVCKGVKHVICTVGAGGGKGNNANAVDNLGVANLALAAAGRLAQAGSEEKKGEERISGKFVLVSSMSITKTVTGFFMDLVLGGLATAKLKGEDAVRKSGVTYTIVRPGQLKNNQGGNPQKLDQGDRFGGGGNSTSREDVALVCIAAMQSADADSKTFEHAQEKSKAVLKELAGKPLVYNFAALKKDEVPKP